MISHFDIKAFVPCQGKAYANRAAAAAARLPVFARMGEADTGQGARSGGACKTMKRGAAAQAAVTFNGPVSVEHGEQDRCEGSGSVPAHFRTVVQKRGYSELYALRCLDLPAMDVGGLDLLDRYEQRIAQEDPFLQTADDMSFFCHGDGAFLKLDQDGRITMTDFIREHTGISAEVAFVGRGNFFQIWEPGRLAAYGAQARARLLQLRQGTKPGERPE